MARKPKTFSLKERAQSFRYAFTGLAGLLRFEHNFRIHLFATVLALFAGFLLKLSHAEWLILILLIALVLVAEAFNSALEKLADEVTLERRENIGKLKDYSAAAVLLASMATLAGGLVLFLPKILDLLRQAAV